MYKIAVQLRELFLLPNLIYHVMCYWHDTVTCGTRDSDGRPQRCYLLLLLTSSPTFGTCFSSRETYSKISLIQHQPPTCRIPEVAGYLNRSEMGYLWKSAATRCHWSVRDSWAKQDINYRDFSVLNQVVVRHRIIMYKWSNIITF